MKLVPFVICSILFCVALVSTLIYPGNKSQKPSPPSAPRVVDTISEPVLRSFEVTARGLMAEAADTGFMVGWGAQALRANANELAWLRTQIRSNRMDLIRVWFDAKARTVNAASTNAAPAK